MAPLVISHPLSYPCLVRVIGDTSRQFFRAYSRVSRAFPLIFLWRLLCPFAAINPHLSRCCKKPHMFNFATPIKEQASLGMPLISSQTRLLWGSVSNS